MRGFRFRSSLKIVIRVFSRCFAARVFGLRPKTCRPPADQASRRTREKTSDTQDNARQNAQYNSIVRCWNMNIYFFID